MRRWARPSRQRKMMLARPTDERERALARTPRRLGGAGMIPVLSKWDQRVVGVHERAQVGEAGGEVWQGLDAEPGQQEAGTDEGLEEQPQVGEPMLPTGIVRPGGGLPRRRRPPRGPGRRPPP